ncbi:MAG: aminopeptidase P N-terminal domain-containing protein [Gemmatimonadetes bacterium]|nr:aminopeptidase P N-terminal domain-containing protein [Gemmatimonadota bacterium]
MRILASSITLALLPSLLGAQAIPDTEYVTRRDRLMETLPDGIVLLHARSAAKEMEQPSFVQDPSFFYLTGLPNLPGAVLALDGPRRESHLFVPPPPLSFGQPVHGLIPPATEASARQHGFTTVRSWDELAGYVRARLDDGVNPLYLDGSRRSEATGNPPGFRPVAGATTLWHAAVADAFPDATIESARPAITAMRWVKSAAEVAVLRRNADATAAALLAGMRAVRPGITQRESEAAVIQGCIDAGGEGPSFWPWTMSGPNAHVGQLVRAFYDYAHLNRTMEAGELVRMDVGCAGGYYGGDVGRTIPTSGVFDPDQREVWNLLIAGYRAGMDAMRAGVTRTQVQRASTAGIRALQPGLETTAGLEAAAFLLSGRGREIWSIHGVGVESGEEALNTLEAGSVIAFEPMLQIGAHAYYLEDMILVTATGHEVLSAGLPYTAEEIEGAMRSLGR